MENLMSQIMDPPPPGGWGVPARTFRDKAFARDILRANPLCPERVYRLGGVCGAVENMDHIESPVRDRYCPLHGLTTQKVVHLDNDIQIIIFR